MNGTVLAEMDANWLVLKPRLGLNNPQPYATWFSLAAAVHQPIALPSFVSARRLDLKYTLSQHRCRIGRISDGESH